ncbi:MAG TPA: translation initiation factor IF-2 [Candidatus Dormibacteraeota bacterium]|nr:translation initiation factor IF-2 [Candidatus Dormibacteraeota bacterium]
MKRITLPVTLTVKDLADRLGVKLTDVIKYLMENQVMASANASIDFDTAALTADHFGFEAESEDAVAAAAAAPGRAPAGAAAPVRRRHPLVDVAGDDPGKVEVRPPGVTVLGHVDHGKTSLLDAIRDTKVAAGEAGGITQRIGAYQVTRDGRRITFIDTPGHAAFTAMRARGADVTDVAVLVVAADDGVMPQTEEAIQHARSAGVPIVVALNKIDRENADPDRVLGQLAERGLVPVQYGGDTEVVRTSARTGTGLDDLLETVLLTSDLNEPRANPHRHGAGTVIESSTEKGRGTIATVLVQNGTLHVGDPVVAGAAYGRVRSLTDDTGKRIKEAGPSTPVVVTGLNDAPPAGEMLQVVDNEKAARTMAEERAQREARQRSAPARKITLADLAQQVAEGGVKSLNVILKAEAAGSLEALKGQVGGIEDPTVRVKIVAEGVGAVSESDVDLAAVTDSIVIGFNVRPDVQAKAGAERQGVDVRFYDVIYQVTDDIEKAIKGMYEPTFIEVFQGRAEVRRVYQVDGKNAIAGSNVLEGKITRNAIARVLRDGKEIVKARIDRLRRFKDDVREVTQGFDCGITVEDFTDFAEGDVIEAFVVEQQNL